MKEPVFSPAQESIKLRTRGAEAAGPVELVKGVNHIRRIFILIGVGTQPVKPNFQQFERIPDFFCFNLFHNLTDKIRVSILHG